MCGRFVRSCSVDKIAEVFEVDKPSIDLPPSYNVAPTQDIIIINSSGKKRIVKCRWGFVPSRATDLAVGSSMINARAETVSTKPAFRDAFRRQRCLVIADGFYEWRKAGKKKVPHFVRLTSGRPFGFAGLYNLWTSPDGGRVCTCTIITTAANDLLEPLHDRMPAIIPHEKEDLWLDPNTADAGVLLEMLKPFPSEEMEYYEVSGRVGSPSFDMPEAIEPVG
jgi:putative SOS response-associated peptidase YedK